MSAFTFEKISPFSGVHKVSETADGHVRTYGIVTNEDADKEGEICDYADAKKQYMAWSSAFENATKAAGQEISKGNIRVQHGSQMGGKAIDIKFDDASKTIYMGTEAADSDIGNKLKRGYFTGLSQAGSYLYRRCDICATPVVKGSFCATCQKNQQIRYAPILAEVSYVDNPCLEAARFTFVKADGTEEQRPFITDPKEDLNMPISFVNTADSLSPTSLSEVLRRLDQTQNAVDLLGVRLDEMGPVKIPAEEYGTKSTPAAKQVLHLVSGDGGEHLPVTDAEGKADHRLMGAAWAALHGGYRGNKYEGPDKEGALGRLKHLYEKEGMELPSEKFLRLGREYLGKRAEPLSDEQATAAIERAMWVQKSEAWETFLQTSGTDLPQEVILVLDHAAIKAVESGVGKAAGAASEDAAAQPAQEDNAGEKMQTGSFIEQMTKFFGGDAAALQKAHSLAHHMGKMGTIVKSHTDGGVSMHKAHHAAMAQCLGGDVAKSAGGAGGAIQRALQMNDAHMYKGAAMHSGHMDDMSDCMGKLGKILGMEEADKWGTSPGGGPEATSAIPMGATPSHYDAGAGAGKSASLTAEDVGNIVKAAFAEFIGGMASGTAPVEEHKAAGTGIGDRNDIQWPQMGQGRGITKAQDVSGMPQPGTANAPQGQPEAPTFTEKEIEKAAQGYDRDALRKLGFGAPGTPPPAHTMQSLGMVGINV